MRKSLTVGILAETNHPYERRAPLVPQDVAWLKARGISTEVISSSTRVFSDRMYERAGAAIVKRFRKATLLTGVKEPHPSELIPHKIYCIFSHTAKGQECNRPLLRAFVENKITLIDYEYIADKRGGRLAYFGRFAGLCGMLDSLACLGKRWEMQGIRTPLAKVKRAWQYSGLKKARKELAKVLRAIREKGFPQSVSPFIVGITGHGNVARGAQEILEMLNPIEIHPRDMTAFVRHQRKRRKQIYKIVFTREEKLRAKDRGGFYFEEYLEWPERFESNLDRYLPWISLFVHASYWDKRYPRLVTEAMIRKMSKGRMNRLAFIGDLTCDVRGGVEITQKVTNRENPVFIYEPETGTVRNGLLGDGIAVLAVDNLPSELPRDASREFSAMIRDYIYQTAVHGVTDVTHHHALPAEVRQAVICQEGRLTKPFQYLKKY